jgi:hypothetical protein
VSSFSDDETWHIDSIKNQGNKLLAYDGTTLPEQAELVSVGARPADIVDGDTLALEIDHGPSTTVVFQAMDTTLLDVVNRINAAVPDTASVRGTELRLVSQVADSVLSSIVLNGGTAVDKLGFSMPHHSPWFVVSDVPDDVTLSLVTEGVEEFLRYKTDSASKTLCMNKVGYPAVPSIGFELSVRIRINTAPVAEDSGVYVGLSGSANVFGYTIAIGWGGIGSHKYVKLQDMNSGNILYRIPMDWFDGIFHTYTLSYDELNKTFRLSIDT